MEVFESLLVWLVAGFESLLRLLAAGFESPSVELPSVQLEAGFELPLVAYF